MLAKTSPSIGLPVTIGLSEPRLPKMRAPLAARSKSRLPHKAQPVPPIFQPEVAAQAIVYAAEHGRREIYVGWPTVKTIVGDKIVSNLLDRYLVKMVIRRNRPASRPTPTARIIYESHSTTLKTTAHMASLTTARAAGVHSSGRTHTVICSRQRPPAS